LRLEPLDSERASKFRGQHIRTAVLCNLNFYRAQSRAASRLLAATGLAVVIGIVFNRLVFSAGAMAAMKSLRMAIAISVCADAATAMKAGDVAAATKAGDVAGVPLYKQAGAVISARVNDLLSRMTVEEKVSVTSVQLLRTCNAR
jgi:hypothetical protein